MNIYLLKVNSVNLSGAKHICQTYTPIHLQIQFVKKI